LVDLYDQIQDWLKPLHEKGYVKFRREGNPIEEELLGPYIAPSLIVEFEDRSEMQLLPVGLYVVGASGRVDVMMNARGRDIAIVGKPDTGEWEFAERKEGKYQRFPFTKENLEQIIADAIAGK